jgi:hypothetical protein
MAFTEEVWALGSTLSSGRIVLVAVTSLLTLACFVRSLFYPGKHLREYRLDFLKRLVTSYLLALTVAMVLLILIDKGPLEPKRLDEGLPHRLFRTLLYGQYRLALDSQTDVIIRCVRKDAHVIGKDA